MNTKLPDDLTASIGERRAPKSMKDQRVCPVCGQAYDMADLAAAVHHTHDAHEQSAT